MGGWLYWHLKLLPSSPSQISNSIYLSHTHTHTFSKTTLLTRFFSIMLNLRLSPNDLYHKTQEDNCFWHQSKGERIWPRHILVVSNLTDCWQGLFCPKWRCIAQKPFARHVPIPQPRQVRSSKAWSGDLHTLETVELPMNALRPRSRKTRRLLQPAIVVLFVACPEHRGRPWMHVQWMLCAWACAKRP